MNKILIAGILLAAGAIAAQPVLAQTATPMNIRCLQEPGLCGDFPNVYSMALPGSNWQPMYILQMPAVIQPQMVDRRAADDAAGTSLDFGTDSFPTW